MSTLKTFVSELVESRMSSFAFSAVLMITFSASASANGDVKGSLFRRMTFEASTVVLNFAVPTKRSDTHSF